MAITEKYENLQPFWPRGDAVVCSVDIGAVELLTITVYTFCSLFRLSLSVVQCGHNTICLRA
jgi:hypothetical protein